MSQAASIAILEVSHVRDGTAPSGAAPVRRRRTGVLAVAGMFLLVVSGVSALRLSQPAANLAPSIVAPPTQPAVVGLGYLEPSGGIIRIGAPGSPDALRLATLTVADGDEVDAGQIIATLDTADKATAQLRATESQVTLKRLILERQRHEIKSSLTARRSALERARAELDAVKADFDRQQTLFERGITTTANVEKKRRELLTAEASVREMDAALKRVETLQGGTATGNLREPSLIDIAVTEQEVAAAEADLAVQKASLDLATIRAPIKGRILAVKTRAGERIGTDSIVEIGAVATMRAVIEVYQTDIARVRIGQSVQVRADVLGQPVVGKVERLGAAIKRQTVVNNDPATATDARVIEVFVTFDAEASRAIAHLSRLQVTAVFAP